MRRGFDTSGMFRYLQERLGHASWSELDSRINLFFVFVLIIGVIFFIYVQLSDSEPRGPFSRNLFLLFFMTGVSYLFWINDLVFGLPFGLSRYRVVPALMGLGFLYFLIVGFLAYWTETQIPVAKGFKRCPKCKAVILELSVQCPECRQKI